jgi:hypothetical protein
VAIGGIIFYILTHMALKLSILLQYVRISVMPFEKHFCYTIIAILIAQSIAMAVTHLSLCRRFHALWTPNVPGTVCLDRTVVYFAQLGLTIGMDFAVLIAPLFILRHLTLPWIQKIMILVVLSFGGMYVILHGKLSNSLRRSNVFCTGHASSRSSASSPSFSRPSPRTARTRKSAARSTA